jgi:hypothetical protein
MQGILSEFVMVGTLLNKWTVILILAALLSILIVCRREAKPLQIKLDADGKLTYHGLGYRLRVWPNQVSQAVWIEGALKRGPVIVMLSIDRREFGAPEAPGAPRVTCKADGSCSDSCAGEWSCDDLKNGWYRVVVLPLAETWGVDPHELNLGPQMGTGFLCADSKRPGLEVCWDPARIERMPKEHLPKNPRFRDDTLQSVSNVRPVWYPAIKNAAAYVWVSAVRDVDGRPAFIASCGPYQCRHSIEQRGARLDVTFSSDELDHWQRFNAGLHDFAARLIESVADQTR